MKNLLDEILSPEVSGKPHDKGCDCSSCASKEIYPHWKNRRQQRTAPKGACSCKRCQKHDELELEYSDTDWHTYWRRRRQLRHHWPLQREWEGETNSGPYKSLAQSFLQGQRTAAVQLSTLRKQLNLPPVGQEGRKKYTLAKLMIGNKVYYGINAHGTPLFLKVNNISRTHAEGDVFNQAKRDGLTSPIGFLFLDRPMCIPCGVKGAVTSMARQVGLKRLVIIEPGSSAVIQL